MVPAAFAGASVGRCCKNASTHPRYGLISISTAAAGNVTERMLLRECLEEECKYELLGSKSGDFAQRGLQICAMTSLNYDPQIKEYYSRKKAEGKEPMLVLNNVRCKLISRVFAVINRETAYVDMYKFAF